ncbi:MAG: hypothetical protein AABX02_04485, partial [archaeon]
FRRGITACAVGTKMIATGEGTVTYIAEITELKNEACAYTINRNDLETGNTQTMSCVDPQYGIGRADLGSMRENCTGLFDEFAGETTAVGTEEGGSSETETSDTPVTASPKLSAGSVYIFSPLPGCRETITPSGKAVRVCPIATQKALQPVSPLTGFLTFVSNWGGK